VEGLNAFCLPKTRSANYMIGIWVVDKEHLPESPTVVNENSEVADIAHQTSARLLRSRSKASISAKSMDASPKKSKKSRADSRHSAEELPFSNRTNTSGTGSSSHPLTLC